MINNMITTDEIQKHSEQRGSPPLGQTSAHAASK